MSANEENSLYKKAAELLGEEVNYQTVRKYWVAMQAAICERIYVTGRCDVPLLGTFIAKKIPERIARVKIDGVEEVRKFPEHIYPKFTPLDNFVNDTNFCGVTKRYRYRLANNKLSQKDIERLEKAEALEQLRHVGDKEVESVKTSFAELLEQKKQRHEERKLKGNELSTEGDSSDQEI